MRPLAAHWLLALAIFAIPAQGALQLLHAHPLGGVAAQSEIAGKSDRGSSSLQAACDLCEMLSHSRTAIVQPELAVPAPAPVRNGLTGRPTQLASDPNLQAPNSRAPPALS